MTTRWTDEPAWWVGLQPTLAFAPVPDAILRTEHPPAALAVEHCEVANREAECAGLKTAVAALLDQNPVSSLGVRERIDSHGESIARRLGRLQVNLECNKESSAARVGQRLELGRR